MATAQAAPIVEPQRTEQTERTFDNVLADVLAHGALAAAWAGVAASAWLLWEAWAAWPLARWEVGGTGVVVVFLWCFALVATARHRQAHAMRGRDLKEWLQLEGDYEKADRERREALAEVDRLHHELSQAHSTIEGLRTSKNFTPAGPSPRPSPQGDDAGFDATVREVARRFQLGLDYSRDKMVADEACTPGTWSQAMKRIQAAGYAQARGRGGKLIINPSARAADILDAVL